MMDKNALVNIDLQPVADVTNNLIDKLAGAVGWVFTPKGNKAQEIEAQNYLIQKIMEDENMPPLTKAAAISRAKKIIKEYINQNDIVNEALLQLSDHSNPRGVDAEWLSLFMDHCKNIDSDNVRAIWVKVLSEECNENGSMPKKLLSILATISNDNAIAFSNLCAFAVNIPLKKDEDFHELSLYWRQYESEYNSFKVNYGKVLELESMGLVNVDMDRGYMINTDHLLMHDNKLEIQYCDNLIELGDVKTVVHLGNVVFTDAGRALFSVIGNDFSKNKYELIKNAIENNM